uniref:ORF2 protein n=1 Tax=Maize-associated trichovirus 1 TaxID=2676058 RepID=A0A6M3R8D1_9VIRU|nr:ORF2 protein [Maize-associated trichovirus 1]
MEVIKVNKFTKEFVSSGSLTDQIPSGSIYRDVPWIGTGARAKIAKREINVSLTPKEGGYSIENFPLLDSEDLMYYKAAAKSHPYVDLGCVVISIKGLFRRNAGVKGRLLLLDDMFDNIEQAKISAFKFNLDEGFAAFAVFPGYSIATDDMQLQRLRLIVEFENLNVRSGSYKPVAISVGLITKLSTTAFPPKSKLLEENEFVHQSIVGSQVLSLEEIEGKDKLAEEFRVHSFVDGLKMPEVGSSVRRRKALLRTLPPTRIKTYSADSPTEVSGTNAEVSNGPSIMDGDREEVGSSSMRVISTAMEAGTQLEVRRKSVSSVLL